MSVVSNIAGFREELNLNPLNRGKEESGESGEA